MQSQISHTRTPMLVPIFAAEKPTDETVDATPSPRREYFSQFDIIEGDNQKMNAFRVEVLKTYGNEARVI